MMPVSKLVRMVVANTLRSRKDFILSAFGIVMGIAAFVFFLGLSVGVRSVILGEIFPLEEVTVVAPATTFAGPRRLDDSIVAAIRQRPEVNEALPRMNVMFPADGRGTFEGQDLVFEVGGFADGIPPSFVADDARLAELFRDWETETKDEPKIACAPPPVDPRFDANGLPVAPGTPPYRNPCPKPDVNYCNERTRTCTRRVPVVVSRTLLELYNGQFAASHGLPVINTDIAAFIVARGGLGRMKFTIGLGSTVVTGSNANIAQSKRYRVEGQLVGISSKAMNIGMSMPLEYVRRWNREFVGDEAASTYSSIVVTLKDKDRLAVFSSWLQEELQLKLEDSMGERFAIAIFLVTTLFVLISFVIIAISAINIAHNFFMQVSDRRRELGILRAVGATRADVRLIILGEAALIGVIGGAIGIVLAVGAGALVDFASAEYLPRYPYKPETYFAFRPWIWLSGLGFSTTFCILGGFLPARRAARMEPAQALAQT